MIEGDSYNLQNDEVEVALTLTLTISADSVFVARVY